MGADNGRGRSPSPLSHLLVGAGGALTTPMLQLAGRGWAGAAFSSSAEECKQSSGPPVFTTCGTGEAELWGQGAPQRPGTGFYGSYDGSSTAELLRVGGVASRNGSKGLTGRVTIWGKYSERSLVPTPPSQTASPWDRNALYVFGDTGLPRAAWMPPVDGELIPPRKGGLSLEEGSWTERSPQG